MISETRLTDDYFFLQPQFLKLSSLILILKKKFWWIERRVVFVDSFFIRFTLLQKTLSEGWPEKNGQNLYIKCICTRRRCIEQKNFFSQEEILFKTNTSRDIRVKRHDRNKKKFSSKVIFWNDESEKNWFFRKLKKLYWIGQRSNRATVSKGLQIWIL